MKTKYWSDVSTRSTLEVYLNTKDWQPPEARKEIWKGFSFRAFRYLPIPAFSTSGLLNCERINSCCFKLPCSFKDILKTVRVRDLAFYY